MSIIKLLYVFRKNIVVPFYLQENMSALWASLHFDPVSLTLLSGSSLTLSRFADTWPLSHRSKPDGEINLVIMSSSSHNFNAAIKERLHKDRWCIRSFDLQSCDNSIHVLNSISISAILRNLERPTVCIKTSCRHTRATTKLGDVIVRSTSLVFVVVSESSQFFLMTTTTSLMSFKLALMKSTTSWRPIHRISHKFLIAAVVCEHFFTTCIRFKLRAEEHRRGGNGWHCWYDSTWLVFEMERLR